MFKRIKDKIEKNRNSKNTFWRAAISIKDFFWVLSNEIFPLRTTLKWNRCWNDYNWISDGDEWDNQAAFCKKPYKEWKISIAKNFIEPNISRQSTILEIAPGHGRWTEFMLASKKIFIVDLNKNCIEFCEKKFYKYKNIRYFTNDGRTLRFISNSSIDFIFSYDSFVHMEIGVIDSYFKEFYRILKKSGKIIIHHSGHQTFFPSNLNKRLGGGRANVSEKDIRRLAAKNNLKVNYQINAWGKNKEYNCRAHGDYISELTK